MGDRESLAITTRIGLELAEARRRKKLTQAEVAAMIGVDQTRISQMELGRGAGAPIGTWIAFGIAVDRPLAVSTSRILIVEPQDAGHLRAQETILRLAKAHGIQGTFELPTRSGPGGPFIDVGLRDDRHRTLSVIEIWNRFDDLGAGSRNFKRKLAEAEQLAVVAGGDDAPYRVTGCWVLRATAANRELVARYPSIIASAFPGSSRGWVAALTQGAPAPSEPGIVWIDLAGERVHEARLRD